MTLEMGDRLNGRTFKALLKKLARKPKRPDSDVLESEADLPNKVNVSSDKQRTDLSTKQAHLQKKEENHEDDVEVEAERHLELPNCTESKAESDIESQHQTCVICISGGMLLHCSGQGCRRSFHLSCVNPPLSYVPPGVWHCIWCTERKITFGLHFVSEGIESIWDVREAVSDDKDMQGQKEYLVKYKALAHVHNRWISETQLVSEAPMLVAKYKKKNQTIKVNTEWTVPDRLLDKRIILFPGNDSNTSACRYEWLVKWKGLGYSQASWELENASFLTTTEAMKLINNFESRHKKSDGVAHPPKEDEGRKGSFTELSELPLHDSSPDICNGNLTYVNKLREYWLRGQNCLVIDDQERVVKVVLFILSFRGYLKWPFLIITKSSALSLWEAQFSCWASSENVVVYQGNKDTRSSIKTLEFYNEGGCIMFQVLITTPEVVAEDTEIVQAIKWEAIIIDECERSRVSDCLIQIKMLSADMRLLVCREIKDRRFNYQAVLSLLDSEFEQHGQEIDPNLDNFNFKERLAQFVAFECKSDLPKFAEYWVPVRLSNVQIEQCCESLLSCSAILCSNSKTDSVYSLRELLALTRKCCDHPYLVDHSVQSRLTAGLSEAENLDVGIEVSGKLQLLDKILTETKKNSLKVLIMFQSRGGSGSISSIGDILSDFVHQRFGQDSYTRIDREIIRLRKKGSVHNIFNTEESEKFVCLIESHACRSSIKFSSLDVVIIFGSDMNPMNDIRALQKLTVSSEFDQIKVLRLYSSFTVEEQILILAKQGVTLDSCLMNINKSTCHILLNWGAYYLFDKLDILHSCSSPASHSSSRSEQSLMNNVFPELLVILTKNCKSRDSTGCSFISHVQQSDGAYKSNVMLLGEVEFQLMQNFVVIKQFMDDEPPHALWRNLLEGREHKWKYLPEPSLRRRKKVQCPINLSKELDSDVMPRKRKRIKVVGKAGNRTAIKARLTNKNKVSAPTKENQVAGVFRHLSGNISKCVPCSDNNMQDVTHASNPSSTPLESNNVSEDCVGGYDATLGEHNLHDVNHASSSSSIPNEPNCVLEECHGDEVTLGEQVTQFRQCNETTTTMSGVSPCDTSASPVQPHPLPPQLGLSPLDQHTASPNPPTQDPQQPVVELSGLFDSSDMQPNPTLPPSLSRVNFMVGNQLDDPYCRRAVIFSEYGYDNPQYPVTSEMPHRTPLQIELERVKKDNEQAIKAYEDMNLKLISDRDKETAEIHKKYDALLQQAEMTSKRHIDDLKRRYANLYMNELLANAFIQKNKPDNQDVLLPLLTEATVPYLLNGIDHLFGQPVTTVTTPVGHQSLAEPLIIPQYMNQLDELVNQAPVVYPAAELLVPRSEQSFVNMPMEGLPPITSSVQLAPLSGFQQAATHFGQHMQQSSARLPIFTPGPGRGTPSMGPVNFPSPVQQNAGNMPKFPEFPACHITNPLAIPTLQSGIHRSVLSSNSQRPLNVPTYSSNVSACNLLRTNAPAPHLRHRRPSSYIQSSNSRTYNNLLTVLQPTTNSPLTPVQSAFQSGSLMEFISQSRWPNG